MNKKIIFLLISVFYFFSCSSAPKIEENLVSDTIVEEENGPVVLETEPIPVPEEPRELFYPPRCYQPDNEELTLLFGGDIMAHEPNFKMKDYSKIWTGIKDLTSSCDLTFGNIEAPVAESIPLSSYPSFNMHENYVQAAIDAGFNVFSLANNHTNDKYKDGILQTMAFAEKTETASKNSDRKIYFSGLKNGKDAPFSYHLIENKGWKILFVAITQLLNRPDDSQYINYVPSKKENKEAFLNWCKKIKQENPCDFFIVSLHTNEEEYIREVTKKQRNWYNEIMNSGVDIIWANHAHLIKHQEVIHTDRNSRYASKLLMCANGNVISGQRTSPNLDLKFTERDDTGDGLLYKVVLRKTPDSENAFIFKTERYFYTTYKNTASEYILKKLDDDFIDYLKENRTSWVEYIKKRKSVCEGIEEKIIKQ